MFWIVWLASYQNFETLFSFDTSEWKARVGNGTENVDGLTQEYIEPFSLINNSAMWQRDFFGLFVLTFLTLWRAK